MAPAIALIARRLAALSLRQRWILAGFAMVILMASIGTWAALRKDIMPAYFIVKKWGGRCVIVTEQQTDPEARLLWFGNLRVSAEDKLREYVRGKRCH